MITECYIKGRYDNGKGKCAVVIVEADQIVHKVGWAVPQSWTYCNAVIEADQFNCEILAATYAAKWCRENGKKVVNLYTNNNSTYKWYTMRQFPEHRFMGEAFLDESKDITDIFGEYIPKKSDNIYNLLVNELAEKV